MPSDFYRSSGGDMPPPVLNNRGFIEIWVAALVEPTVENYRDLLQEIDTSAGRSMTWIFIGSLISAIFASLTRETTAGMEVVSIICSPFIAILATLLWALFVGLLNSIAQGLDGTGSFDHLAFLLAACYLPLSLASSVLNLIPGLGQIINLFIGLYLLYLGVVATNAAHDLGWLKAAIAFLGTVVVVFVALACCISMLLSSAQPRY